MKLVSFLVILLLNSDAVRGTCASTDDGNRSSRKKRTPSLPNRTSMTMSSRLIVPQPPVGLYLVWIRVNLFLRSMFTEAITDTGSGTNANLFAGRRKRSERDAYENVLTRSLADDQADILKNIEESLTKGGINGKQCVLRAVCELSETPIGHWSVVGEMIHAIFEPKRGNHSKLNEYHKAELLGEEHGECWSAYPDCPISIFNFIPDIYTTDDEFELSWENVSASNDIITDDEKINNLIKDGKISQESNIDININM